jgi:hypothetical protein
MVVLLFLTELGVGILTWIIGKSSNKCEYYVVSNVSNSTTKINYLLYSVKVQSPFLSIVDSVKVVKYRLASLSLNLWCCHIWN